MTGRRVTRQRAAVAALLERTGDFTSAQQLHARLRDGGDPIGLATVYRTLAAMAADGQIDVLRGPDGEAAYRRCSDGHHHHLVCRECGYTVEVEGPAVETWAEQLGRRHGFRDVRHTVEVSGTCRSCRARHTGT
ncbi:MAG: Fur family transcriptional regulator [Dermatophilaceae bacterium]